MSQSNFKWNERNLNAFVRNLELLLFLNLTSESKLNGPVVRHCLFSSRQLSPLISRPALWLDFTGCLSFNIWQQLLRIASFHFLWWSNFSDLSFTFSGFCSSHMAKIATRWENPVWETQNPLWLAAQQLQTSAIFFF